jgi:hypothetical protein
MKQATSAADVKDYCHNTGPFFHLCVRVSTAEVIVVRVKTYIRNSPGAEFHF